MTIKAELKYIHAINILATAKIDALQNISDHFGGDFQKAFNSPELARLLPIDLDFAKAKRVIDPEKEWKKLEKEKIEVITILDKAYPKTLKHIPHPPFVLYIRGSKEILKSKCFGVVGTRALTDYGRRATPDIVRDIVRGGLTIVSGLATGIDTLAHKAAIDNSGKTIAVLGCGPDDQTIFPQQNLRLAHKILETGGAIISEYAPGTQGRAFTFPQRNRIISGLSLGVLVVEADIKSGAMITAYDAVDQNRDLFCVPGSIYGKTSQGTNLMIQKGAKLVTTGHDILEEYEIYLDKKEIKIKADNPVEEKILAILTGEPVGVDDIIRRTMLDAAQINGALVLMEMNKKVRSLGNNKFVRYS